MPKAKVAAIRALEIDPTLVEGHMALGFIRGWFDFDWEAAEKELTRAVELDPNHAMAHLYYGWLLMHTGHADAAVAQGRTAYELDPLAPFVELGFAQMYYACNQPQIAIERLKRLAQTSPDFKLGRFYLAYSYLIANQYRDAARELDTLRRLYPKENFVLVLEAFTRGKLGDSGPARSLLGQLQQEAKSGYMSPYLFAMANAAAGRAEDAITWLQRAYDERDGSVHGLGVDPVFAHLRSDPRVRAVNISKAGLSTCHP